MAGFQASISGRIWVSTEVSGSETQLLDRGTVYFETSAWNRLAKDPESQVLVERLQQRGAVVLASVITAGELLQTSDPAVRESLCAVMGVLLGERPLLERPGDFAAIAAKAFLAGQRDMLLTQTAPGRSLLGLLHRPGAVDRGVLEAWLANIDGNLERFRAEVRPDAPKRTTRYHSLEVMRTEAFLRLLLATPPAVELGLSLSEVADLCEKVDA